ncbi:MAG: DUF1573 domain-containing protein, partial [Bacteroidota bacterium]
INATIPKQVKPELDAAVLDREKEARREKRREARRAKRRAERRKRKESQQPLIDFYEATHQFGTIQQGEEVKHQFKFKNTGQSALVISDVQVSCGCTQPSYPFIPIEPGEEGYIGVLFKSAGRLGKQRPTITVVTNADPKTYKLHLEGIVDAKREGSTEQRDSLQEKNK